MGRPLAGKQRLFCCNVVSYCVEDYCARGVRCEWGNWKVEVLAGYNAYVGLDGGYFLFFGSACSAVGGLEWRDF